MATGGVQSGATTPEAVERCAPAGSACRGPRLGVDGQQEQKAANKMDKDRIIGVGKQMVGTAKKVVGKVVGDAKLQTDGKAEQIEGKLQNAVGSAKDTLK